MEEEEGLQAVEGSGVRRLEEGIHDTTGCTRDVVFQKVRVVGSGCSLAWDRERQEDYRRQARDIRA